VVKYILWRRERPARRKRWSVHACCVLVEVKRVNLNGRVVLAKMGENEISVEWILKEQECTSPIFILRSNH
jgi:hypothetical protein